MKNDHWTSKLNKVLIWHFDNDFWFIRFCQAERNRFIKRLQKYAQSRRIRISFLTGDVHCAAVGVLKTLTKGRKSSLEPESDHRYMLNVVTSRSRSSSMLRRVDPHVQVRLSTLRKLFAPGLHLVSFMTVSKSRPPNFALTLVDWWSKKPHRTLHHAETDEEMVS